MQDKEGKTPMKADEQFFFLFLYSKYLQVEKQNEEFYIREWIMTYEDLNPIGSINYIHTNRIAYILSKWNNKKDFYDYGASLFGGWFESEAKVLYDKLANTATIST